MVKLTVLYGHPTDAEAFDDHYANTHDPLAKQIPNLQRFEAGRVSTMDDSESPYHLLAELWFEDMETLEQSMSSEEGRAATDDIPNFATGGVTLLVSEVA
jgi:uncharacterized protein (TIGR02118 family)